MPDTWTVHCDGSALPNPGRMAYGAVIAAPDGTRHTLSQATTAIGCNNEAELLALAAALREAYRLGAREVLVHSDNSILVAQLGSAASRVAIARLEARFDEVRALLGWFRQIRLQWIPRHRNAEADALARAAQGLPPKAAKMPNGRKKTRRLSTARQKTG